MPAVGVVMRLLAVVRSRVCGRGRHRNVRADRCACKEHRRCQPKSLGYVHSSLSSVDDELVDRMFPGEAAATLTGIPALTIKELGSRVLARATSVSKSLRKELDMNAIDEYQKISPTTLADVLGHEQVLDGRIRALWSPIPRVAGPAFTVRCPPGDNLMLHAAIHRAERGSVIVVAAGDVDYAVSGGNVCAVAQRRGIAAFVVDGVIRDIAEVRDLGFPVFARGVMPIPGGKDVVTPLNEPVQCGGVTVAVGDVVVADEEGIVVVPVARSERVLAEAQAKATQEAGQSLEEWETAHRARIDSILARHGFTD
jgi:regulator of RNase E activity RraA